MTKKENFMQKRIKEIASSCPCGVKHRLDTNVIETEKGSADLLSAYVKDSFDAKRALAVADENTKIYADGIVTATGADLYVCPGAAHANEIETGKLSDFIKGKDISVMIAVGTGSVHDITRYVAHQISVPFISCPTGASVDGFVSGVAAMTWYGQKLTFPSASPVAIFADPDIYKTAPHRLLASGVGDMIGKIISLFDWKIANLLTGEHLCREIYSLTNEALDDIISASENTESDEFAESVMNGLILSGLAMQLEGNSRPASGSEHHMSHLWEMHVLNAPTDALHGEKVGVGTINIIKMLSSSQNMIKCGLDFNLDTVFSRELLTPAFGSLTDGILNENVKNGQMSSSALAKVEMPTLYAKADEILSMIDSLPSAEFVEKTLSACGAPVTTAELSLPEGDDFIQKSLLYSPYVRNRLTLSKIISAHRISNM
ncbi:MAG: iron-containing alcohol dehydrogenase [Firmicutes bacterium]|nr:iron-containing alcohol dehydrogenase [Bacillota bacterium]